MCGISRCAHTRRLPYRELSRDRLVCRLASEPLKPDPGGIHDEACADWKPLQAAVNPRKSTAWHGMYDDFQRQKKQYKKSDIYGKQGQTGIPVRFLHPLTPSLQ